MTGEGKEREVVPGLMSSDVKKIADQILNRTDENHPYTNKNVNGFLDILENGEPNISASEIFIRKANDG